MCHFKFRGAPEKDVSAPWPVIKAILEEIECEKKPQPIESKAVDHKLVSVRINYGEPVMKTGTSLHETGPSLPKMGPSHPKAPSSSDVGWLDQMD